MNIDGRWILVSDAAALVGRTEWTIYDWIRKGRVRSDLDTYGRTVVDGRHLLEVEPTVRRGRPRGSVSVR